MFLTDSYHEASIISLDDGVDMNKIMVTGSEGMLVESFKNYFATDSNEVLCPTRNEMDITNRDNVLYVCEKINPKFIFHLAAITNLELCERDKSLAHSVNVEGTRNVVEYCKSSNTKLVYMSSGAVFNGKKETPYTEFDIPDPISEYGKTKYEAEWCILESSVNYLILRLGWLFGGFQQEKKFVGTILKQLLSGKEKIYIVNDIRGTPTFIDHVAQSLDVLLNNHVNGLFNVANGGVATRYDMACAIVSEFELSKKVAPEVIGVTHNYFANNYSAPRPVNESLDTTKLSQYHQLPLWETSLKKYVMGILDAT